MFPFIQLVRSQSLACRVGIVVSALMSARASAAAPPVGYYDHVKPLLAVHCYKCHGPETAKAGLRLDRREGALATLESGAVAIVPGDASRSEMYRRITSHDADERMPPKGERLPAAAVEQVRAWIDQGARWPDRDDYWAFASPKAPPVPEAEATNPIDAFIAERLKAAGIIPAPPADARTLLRRAYADLLGIPPSPEEADAFLRDTSPDAYVRLVDRLLSDPRYGQRWARHWLDLVRYSESDGFEDDKVRPHAWRYRDYVIRSFNADKPYDRFVREQIAGDELWPDDPDAWVATGFARLGAWDGMSKEPERRRQDFLNDATDTVGSVFLGVTIGCARCHDHKYDAITQRDYYALQAFFAGVTRETRDLPRGAPDDPPHVRDARERSQAELARLRGERDTILREAQVSYEWAHRCEVDERGRIAVNDAGVKQAAEALHPGRFAELDREIKQWEPVERLTRAAVEAVFETGASAPRTFLLKGGELSRPGPEVRLGFIEAMSPTGGTDAGISAPPAGAKTSGRRAALARWLTSPQNPLTARVWVNRLWQHHFGQGLVATPSDFGRHGQPPTHPALLNWLACRLVTDGWSTKAMHRLIMTSAAYQRSSASTVDAATRDPQNQLLWRMNRRRLEAEAIRDGILAVSGQLSPTGGGPGVYPRIPADVNVQLPNNDKELSWGTSSAEEDRRRSVYIFQRRSLTFPLVEVFDGAAMSQSCPVRAATTVAPQALALLNGEFCRSNARHMAQRVMREAGEASDARIAYAFQLAFARRPEPAELDASKAFLVNQVEVRRAAGKPAGASAGMDADAAALQDFCHVLLNANEFIYLD